MVDQLVMHYAADGFLLHKGSDDAKRQIELDRLEDEARRAYEALSAPRDPNAEGGAAEGGAAEGGAAEGGAECGAPPRKLVGRGAGTRTAAACPNRSLSRSCPVLRSVVCPRENRRAAAASASRRLTRGPPLLSTGRPRSAVQTCLQSRAEPGRYVQPSLHP